jgi:magnesium transporter
LNEDLREYFKKTLHKGLPKRLDELNTDDAADIIAELSQAKKKSNLN